MAPFDLNPDSVPKHGRVVGLNVFGDGLSHASAQLEVRFQERDKDPECLLVTACAAPQVFTALCAMALFAYEKQCEVVAYTASPTDYRLVYMQLPNLV